MFKGKMYGPGDTELPEANDEQTKKFLAKIDQREGAAVNDIASQIDELVAKLPSGHIYAQLFNVRNTQPEKFEGQPMNAYVPAVGDDVSPAGATVSGEEQDGPLADMESAGVPAQPTLSVRSAGTMNPRTVAAERAAASASANDTAKAGDSKK
jgi:hypothetical protein